MKKMGDSLVIPLAERTFNVHPTQRKFALLLVDCVGLYVNDLTASLFFNFRINSQSRSKLAIPIRAFVELR